MSRFGFLIDMDGVVYRGPEVIAGAVEFAELLAMLDEADWQPPWAVREPPARPRSRRRLAAAS